MRLKTNLSISLVVLVLSSWFNAPLFAQDIPLRQKAYSSWRKSNADVWQSDLRSHLFDLLKLNDLMLDKEKPKLNPSLLKTGDSTSYSIKEIEINSTDTRRIRLVLTIPKTARKDLPAIVCIAGHGGDRYTVYNNNKIYKSFATELARKEFITISADVGQHEIYPAARKTYSLQERDIRA